MFGLGFGAEIVQFKCVVAADIVVVSSSDSHQ